MKNKIKNGYDGLGIQVNIYSVSMHIPSEWSSDSFQDQYNSIFFITAGSCSISLDGKIFTVAANDILFVPNGTLVHVLEISNDFSISFMFSFDVVYEIKKDAVPYHTHIDDPKQLNQLYESMMSIKEEDQLLFAMKAKTYLLMLLSDMMECTHKRTNVHLSSDNFAAEISSYINSRLAEKISIEELANFAGYHPKYFIVLFKKYMGDTPAHYIKKMRLEHSKFLLSYTNTKISEISKRAGFSTQPKFANSFKVYTGLTASEYRKKFKHEQKLDSLK